MKVKNFIFTAAIIYLILKLLSIKPVKALVLGFLVDKSADYFKNRLT
jgi:hypothetical protein